MVPEHPEGSSSCSNSILRKLALQATGMTGADIEFLVREARRTARREGRRFTLADIEDALAQGKPIKLDGTRYHQAVHEAGHVVAQLYFGGDVQLVTVNGEHGSAYVVGHFDRHPQLTSEIVLKALMVIGLAGRAAEQQICSFVSTGSGGGDDSDLARATRLAFDLEMTLGFGAEYPLLYRDAKDPWTMLTLNSEVAIRVNRRLEEAYAIARDLVAQQRQAIEYLADRLMLENTLEGETLAAAVDVVRNFIASSGRMEHPGMD